MAAPDEQLALIGGHLILSPASATAGAGGDYGGTILGTIQAVELEQEIEAEDVTAEEYGGEPVDAVFLGERWRIRAQLGNLDTSGLAQAFLETSAGSGLRYFTWPHTSFKPGGLMSSKRVDLLFAPRDATTQHGFRALGAVLLPERARTFRFGSDDEWRAHLEWRVWRADSGAALRHGLVADLMA